MTGYFNESVTFDSGLSFAGGTVEADAGQVAFINEEPRFARRIRSDALPPIMSYVNPEKSTSSGANVVQRQRQRWVSLVENAAVIGIIGVRVRLHGHVNGRLQVGAGLADAWGTLPPGAQRSMWGAMRYATRTPPFPVRGVGLVGA